MKVQVIGTKVGRFTDKDSGELIEFGKIHCICNFGANDTGVEGQQCLIISCKPNRIPNVRVPYTADVQFNQYGRLADIDPLEVTE